MTVLPMNRRQFAALTSGFMIMGTSRGDEISIGFAKATELLAKATDSGTVRAASLFVQQGSHALAQSFGEAKSTDAAFLLGSISKPIAMAALMTLYAPGRFKLDDTVVDYLPEFRGGLRDRVTIRHLLTHVSGLPDQLPENARLRASHAPLSDFVAGAMRVPIQFEPGTRYEYSSMAILLAAEIAARISGVEIKEFVQKSVLDPLEMKHSAIGTGSLDPNSTMSCQVEFGAAESGAGSPEAKAWDWNSPYWRSLGAPWGGVQASAPDVGKFLHAFLHPTGKVFAPEVAKLMIRNHNPPGIVSRGLGFAVDMRAYCPACSEDSFGHTGSTGTIAWADPQRDLVCVVLTTLPAGATNAETHPREIASQCFA